MNHTIGIVVPVYKVKKEYLEHCVEKLVNQTYKNIEIVLVDDASPDECGKWCDEISKQDDRIKVVHHEVNKGLPGARNTGVDSLKTEWVLFVDADDWLELNTCELLNNEINREVADIYVYSGYMDNLNDSIKCNYIYDNYTVFQTSKDREAFETRFLLDQTKIHINNSFPVQSACCRLVSMKLFKEKGLRFTEIRFAEDAIFHLESTEIANKIIYLQLNLYHYRNTEGSMVNSFRPNCDKEQRSFVNALWSFANKYKKSKNFKKKMYYISYISMQMCVWQKFFNANNNEPYLVRRKACKKFFKTEPYKSTLRNINYNDLRTNQKIKYILLRVGFYQTLVWLRNVNKQHIGELSQ